MRILIISSAEWNDANAFGNTFSNIFGRNKNIEIANIYCRSGIPNTQSCQHFFQIDEKLLLQNLFNRNKPSGQIVFNQDIPISKSPVILSLKEKGLLTFARKKRWMILFWLRDLIWMIGRWESPEMYNFIDNFKPQLIVLPLYQVQYINKMALKIKKRYKIPMVAYVSDDLYTLKQFSLSPLYWLDRIYKRILVKKVVAQCETLYVISDIQKKDYDICFNKNCKMLYKGGDFYGNAPLKKENSMPLQLVYTGNLGAGRYENLSKIGEALDNINKNGIKAILQIYSQTPLNRKMEFALLNKTSIKFGGEIMADKIKEIQSFADILIHVESFRIKERLMVRHSFSTKIVDYFQAARCIFAIGWNQAASIDYLIKNDAAIVASNLNEIENKLLMLIEHPELIKEYANKAWECGRKNHQITEIQSHLVTDLKGLL